METSVAGVRWISCLCRLCVKNRKGSLFAKRWESRRIHFKAVAVFTLLFLPLFIYTASFPLLPPPCSPGSFQKVPGCPKSRASASQRYHFKGPEAPEWPGAVPGVTVHAGVMPGQFAKIRLLDTHLGRVSNSQMIHANKSLITSRCTSWVCARNVNMQTTWTRLRLNKERFKSGLHVEANF